MSHFDPKKAIYMRAFYFIRGTMLSTQKERKYSQWTTVSLTQRNMRRCCEAMTLRAHQGKDGKIKKIQQHFRPALRMPEA